MMDMRDSHLEKALQHAPDRELQPNDEVRRCVLAYAARPVKKHWLQYLSSKLNQWHVTPAQLGGMSSVAVALLVLLMVHEQRPQEGEWAPPASSEQVAKADRLRKQAKVAESAPKPMPARETAREEKAALGELQATPGEIATRADVKSEADKLQVEPPSMADAAPVATPLQESTSPAPAAIHGAEGEIGAAAPMAVLPEQRAKSRLEPLGKNLAMEDDSEDSDLQYELMTQSGTALAERDIQAGKLRLLRVESPNGERCDEPITHAPQVDAETGYPVEVMDVCIVPVALMDGVRAYNQEMRAYKRQANR